MLICVSVKKFSLAIKERALLEEKLRLPLVPVEDKTRSRLREILIEVGLLKETSHAAA
jgi:hypothetical protein